MSDEHQPIQEQWRALLNDMARHIDGIFNKGERGPNRKWGFAILLFPFGAPDDQSRINYISNADRKDMIVAMKEWIARAEGNYHDSTTKQ